MTAIPFETLCKEFQTEDVFLVEVQDKESALADIKSKTSACWGAGAVMGDTGWIQLASPSKRKEDEKRTIFVCKADLIK